MAYSIFLGVPQKRTELHLLELDEQIHDYIFNQHQHMIKKDSRLQRMSDCYSDAVFFYDELDILRKELAELIRNSSDSKLIEGLEQLKQICQSGITQKKNMYCFGD
ncbi:hypothetical protein BegalDRAFT_0998 [Beggiatoa alba B18LD]|uniref:Uncharacterized protein n=1 Tax=Beggiatoa alba B18LD TaxID=395493 RepID=I3CE59_9GAMM|nr:hypothetical protein [Beggiatoa alba]EIJ41902.1 hypothetical protein BegalDRAFT_0998 [Beggiatoa alba B18LD]